MAENLTTNKRPTAHLRTIHVKDDHSLISHEPRVGLFATYRGHATRPGNVILATLPKVSGPSNIESTACVAASGNAVGLRQDRYRTQSVMLRLPGTAFLVRFGWRPEPGHIPVVRRLHEVWDAVDFANDAPNQMWLYHLGAVTTARCVTNPGGQSVTLPARNPQSPGASPFQTGWPPLSFTEIGQGHFPRKVMRLCHKGE